MAVYRRPDRADNQVAGGPGFSARKVEASKLKTPRKIAGVNVLGVRLSRASVGGLDQEGGTAKRDNNALSAFTSVVRSAR
jgi:hypothetical protein